MLMSHLTPDLRPPTSEADTRTLADILGALARRSPDGALVACAAVGVGGAVLIAAVLRMVWWLTPLMLGAAAFGIWGIADRERAALGARGRLFQAVRVAALLVGAAAAAVTAVMLFVVFVGRLQS